VQTTGRGVRTGTKLSPRVQLSKDTLDARESGSWLYVDRDSSTRVTNLDAPVGMESYADRRAVSGECLVHRVIDHFPETMHQTAFVRGPDVHSGALSNRLESFEDTEMAGGILGRHGTVFRYGGKVHPRRAPATRTAGTPSLWIGFTPLAKHAPNRHPMSPGHGGIETPKGRT